MQIKDYCDRLVLYTVFWGGKSNNWESIYFSIKNDSFNLLRKFILETIHLLLPATATVYNNTDQNHHMFHNEREGQIFLPIRALMAGNYNSRFCWDNHVRMTRHEGRNVLLQIVANIRAIRADISFGISDIHNI